MLKYIQSFETLIIFGLYFIPVLLWSIFSFHHMSESSHWTLYSFGLLLACLGTFGIWVLKEKKEQVVPQEPPPAAEPLVQAPPPQEPDLALQLEIHQLEAQIENLKLTHKAEVEEIKLRLMAEYQPERSGKEKEIRDQAERIQELESKVGELEYEIKTLVDFNEETLEDDPWLSSENDASRILKKWLEVGSTISAPHLGQLIQGESRALIFLYGVKEGRALFANSHSLTLFGLTPEQFMEKFHTFLPRESLAWHEALSKTAQDKWAEIRFAEAKGVLALIKEGPLEGHLIGIVY